MFGMSTPLSYLYVDVPYQSVDFRKQQGHPHANDNHQYGCAQPHSCLLTGNPGDIVAAALDKRQYFRTCYRTLRVRIIPSFKETKEIERLQMKQSNA